MAAVHGALVPGKSHQRGAIQKVYVPVPGGQRVFVKGRRATLADGTIAASVLALNDGVRIFRDNVGIPTAQAVELVTRVPATALGLEDRCGTLEVGKQADMTIFDEQLQIRRTIIGGETCYEQEAKANA